MNKFFASCMASILSCSAAFAFWPEAADSSIEVGVGYRQDKLKWEIDADIFGSSETPINLKSKFDWHNLNIWQIDARFKYVTCDNIYFRASGDYGWITSGKFKDRDFIGTFTESTCSSSSSSFSSSSGSSSGSSSSFTSSSSSSTRSSSNSNNFSSHSDTEVDSFNSHSKHGHVYDASIALGYLFRMCDDSFAITPLLGYSWSGQHLEANRHQRCGCSDGSGSGSSSTFSGSGSNNSAFNTKYNTRWNGPWIGLDFDYQMWCDWSLFASYEFHWARYHAKNGNHDSSSGSSSSCSSGSSSSGSNRFPGFDHRARNAHGQQALVGVRWDFCECWTLSLFGEWKYYRAKNGKHIHRIDDESNGDIHEKCFVSLPLKHISWQSGSVTLNIGMMF